MIDWKEHIEMNPDIMYGKPVLRGTRIPVELDIGPITQEDKLEANPNFAEYIAYDTEKVGIPTLIKNKARKFIK